MSILVQITNNIMIGGLPQFKPEVDSAVFNTQIINSVFLSSVQNVRLFPN